VQSSRRRSNGEGEKGGRRGSNQGGKKDWLLTRKTSNAGRKRKRKLTQGHPAIAYQLREKEEDLRMDAMQRRQTENLNEEKKRENRQMSASSYLHWGSREGKVKVKQLDAGSKDS